MNNIHHQKPFKLAIIGFGTVGEGVYWTIERQAKKIRNILGRPLEVSLVLVNQLKDRDILPETKVTIHYQDLLDEDNLDVVVEATPDAEIAYPYVCKLLERGTSVVTANKELIAKHGNELQVLADRNHCDLLFEAAVAGGIPLLNTIRHTLKTNTIERIEGILNGTSNFILTKMREDSTAFAEALREAQEKGYAEAVPDKDIDGWDAYYKTLILSQWVFGKTPIWESDPIGISGITDVTIRLAERFGGRIKHVASLRNTNKEVKATVQPCLVGNDHLLYSVDGVNNGVQIQGDIVGSIMLQGPGAGKFPTASAVVEDVVNLLSNNHEEFIALDEENSSVAGFDSVFDSEGDKVNQSLYFTVFSEFIWDSEGEERAESIDTAMIDQVELNEGTYGAIVKSSASISSLKKLLGDRSEVYPVLSERLVEDSNRKLSKKDGEWIKNGDVILGKDSMVVKKKVGRVV